MASWPGNPVAAMQVAYALNGQGFSSGVTITPNSSTTITQTVLDTSIDFIIDISYSGLAIPDFAPLIGLDVTPDAIYYVWLDRLDESTGGWVLVDSKQAIPLGSASGGYSTDTMTVSVTMAALIEQYRLRLQTSTTDLVPGGADGYSQLMTFPTNATIYLQAVQGEGFIGDFTLDFVPVSIVYCPPGQKSTNSLTQSLSFGTKFSIGNSSMLKAEPGFSFKADFLGLLSEGVATTNSQSVSNQATSGVQISHFRNTVVTADNPRAISPVEAGPLRDIFVILVNPKFATSRRADGTMFYSTTAIEQVVMIPAWKLLRPGQDPIASQLPDSVRQSLLELDPFITNLDMFFPDSGADLSLASDPSSDPSANNRAELIGRWWLDNGTEISYSVGQTHQLFSGETNQLNYGTTVKLSESVGINKDQLKIALGIDKSNSISIGFQSSFETQGTYSTSSSCLVIVDESVKEIYGIALYYDKVFSTFMFRRISTPNDAGTLAGTITDFEQMPLRRLQVSLIGENKVRYQTSTTPSGSYSFYNIPLGRYTLIAGDQQQIIEVNEVSSLVNPTRLDLSRVRRVIDLKTSPIWEVSEVLRLSSNIVRTLGSQLDNVTNEASLAKVTASDATTRELWRQKVVFSWPSKHRPHKDDDSHRSGRRRVDRDNRPHRARGS